MKTTVKTTHSNCIVKRVTVCSQNLIFKKKEDKIEIKYIDLEYMPVISIDNNDKIRIVSRNLVVTFHKTQQQQI